MDAKTILEAIWGYAAAFGVAVVGSSAWLGRVVAERIALRERSRIERESHAHQDALARRRDVYASLAKAMRVFLAGERRSSEQEKKSFLEGYDLGYLWASDEVVRALQEFLGLIQQNTATPGSIPQPRLKEAYAACLCAMRRDSGFQGTPASYQVVNF
jgi:hypothetical protein